MQRRRVSVVALCFLLLSMVLMAQVVQADELETVAYINIAADNWTVQLWPENHFDPVNNPTDVLGTTAVVDGYGQYTVSADFSQTEAGFISQIGFMDVEISNGELVYHNSFMQIDSFKVNGEEVVLGKPTRLLMTALPLAPTFTMSGLEKRSQRAAAQMVAAM